MSAKTENPKTEAPSNAEKDPADWTTGGEPMTGAQASYLKTLCEETGHAFDETLSKADASKLIDELQGQSKRLKSA
ncbi:DUF3072 domain-containing protein [Antarcticirhabdus aurantiaca]|uniref:DUF3072 domain-containing protein n=1 Tax=Antarcticirhabdus aurantiaca TaxID=2606717 RepID=A0ACD4NXH9_9HYPH|nr:DUF3072 domain-containing protein [Antarcticirhabdus aurantiaca]WAJ31362.1 DUF3072 domain-containing protein [Jeongeuplla avenae]